MCDINTVRETHYAQSYDDMFDDAAAERGIVRSVGTRRLQQYAAIAPTSKMQRNSQIDMGGIPEGALEARSQTTVSQLHPTRARSKSYWRTMGSSSAN